jgi:glyoxylase-like metal-dependent hydrolase (beta-lactamase superfamily II)
MIVEALQASYFETNCWVIAPQANSECLIVDPGIVAPSMVGQISDFLRKFNLKPVAALVTHGHLDHTFSVAPLCDNYGIAAYIHESDRRLLTDPFKALQQGGMSDQIMRELGISSFSEPADVQTFTDGTTLVIAGFTLEIAHAPGHTAGSAIFTLDNAYLISGDVLFAGAIGRTDMPTGSSAAMKKSLVEKILPLSDDLIVLPGHGPQTTIGRERKGNPYLQESFLASPSRQGE